LPVHQLLRVLGSEVRGFFRCRGQILSDWPLREKNQRPRSRRPVSAPALQTAYLFLVRTTTAEISAASITASKKSAPVNCERWTSLSPTFSIFPPIFSPDFIRSSTTCPTFFWRIPRIVSPVCRSIVPWAKRSQQANARMKAMRSEEHFISLLLPKMGSTGERNKCVAQASCLWGKRASRPLSRLSSGKMPDGPTGKMPVLRSRLAAQSQ